MTPRDELAAAILATALPALILEEGFRATPYRCTAGALTIGYGTNLDEGLSVDEALFLLQSRVNQSITDCLRMFPWFGALDPVRQGVLVQMRYQLGLTRLLGFRRFLGACARGAFDDASVEMLDSKWARSDSPARARGLAGHMRDGR